jgi:NDP-sugar pyrophosphorylase family protein
VTEVQAVILAGGQGTRLRPITAQLPKPLVPVANRPLVHHQLEHLARSGVRDVTLALGYAADRFAGFEAEAEALGLHLHMVTEPAPLGTGGALRWGADAGAFDPDRPLLWLNGDIVAAPDIDALHRLHAGRAALVTFWLTRARDVSAFGVLELAADGLVERFLEKPAPDDTVSRLINAGILMLDPRVLKRIPGGTFHSFELELLPELVGDREPVYGLFDGGYWRDTGRPRDYRVANRHVLEGRVDWQPAGERIDDALWAGAQVCWD